jgi:hypothetical protein
LDGNRVDDGYDVTIHIFDWNTGLESRYKLSRLSDINDENFTQIITLFENKLFHLENECVWVSRLDYKHTCEFKFFYENCNNNDFLDAVFEELSWQNGGDLDFHFDMIDGVIQDAALYKGNTRNPRDPED